jgi:SAM-dependent methyltransferase
MPGASRVTEYDRIADRYDRRYSLYQYAGTREALEGFLRADLRALEVGCGTGHWLQAMTGRASILAGLEPSSEMLQRAKAVAAEGRIVRGCAEDLPFADASLDRIFAVNALHHFSDRHRFFEEARRVLRPGGAVMTIGKDPHANRDDWWVYDYFEETRAIDQARFAPVRVLRGELALAGFAWAESFEADHIEVVRTAAESFESGVIDRSFTSQLTVLTDEEYARGVRRIRDADAASRANGGELYLIADFRLYATVGWV